MSKPTVAFYWCASCGGCEEAVVDLNEGLLDVAAQVDIALWPVALDFKYEDVEARQDGSIAVSFINGAIRTDEQAHVARMLRAKSQLVVAFGSCAHTGGVPSLANFTTRQAIFDAAYHKGPTTVNPEGKEPATRARVDGYEVTLPGFWDHVHSLDQLIDVDYYLPGCPPMPDSIVGAVDAILRGDLPPRGSVLGSKKALCDTCTRKKSDKPVTHTRFYRPFEKVADPEVCFLDQGIVCCGPATRGGCGEKCLKGNMPCTGCYGPPDAIRDQGAKLLAAVAAHVEGDSPTAVREAVATVLDPAGTFYRYSAAKSLLFARKDSEVES